MTSADDVTRRDLNGRAAGVPEVARRPDCLPLAGASGRVLVCRCLLMLWQGGAVGSGGSGAGAGDGDGQRGMANPSRKAVSCEVWQLPQPPALVRLLCQRSRNQCMYPLRMELSIIADDPRKVQSPSIVLPSQRLDFTDDCFSF